MKSNLKEDTLGVNKQHQYKRSDNIKPFIFLRMSDKNTPYIEQYV